MKRSTCVLYFFLIAPAAIAQGWQQKVDHFIDVRLNPAEKTLDGFEKITYSNHSPDTLYFIWFHVWMNAFKNDRTAYANAAISNGPVDFYFAKDGERGYINRLDFKVNGITATMEDHPEHIDIIRVVLPKPLAPGETAIITTPFHVKLPFNFSRGGYNGQSFQVSQWYPKPAVYDSGGWHPMPYLDQGEYYSEFGDYEVSITVPEDFVVASTGRLQDKEALEKLKNFQKPEPAKKVPVKPGTPKKPLPSISVKPTKTLLYLQKNVHDFAFFADRNFTADYDTCQLASGRVIDLFSFYSKEEAAWKKSIAFAKDALRFYSREVGEYPYDIFSMVQADLAFAGGIEYPTITCLSPIGSEKTLDRLIAHELGHNWFQAALASNERDHPWMDEGMNSFYEEKYMVEKYGLQSQWYEMAFQTKALRQTDQPISLPSAAFSFTNYNLSVYHKAAEWMQGMENHLGPETFRSMMQSYYSTWKYRHPSPADFKKEAQVYLHNSTDSIFSLLHQKNVLPHNQLTGFRFASPLKKHSIRNYLRNPSKDWLLLSPATGGNIYDKTTLGIILTNYKLPPTPFLFYISPLYSFRAKTLVGRAGASYSIHSNGRIRKSDFFINTARFSMDEFEDTAGRRLMMQYQKIVPGFRFTFREKNSLSTVRKQIQWKSFLIREESLRVMPDTIFNGSDTSLILRYLLPSSDSYLNQLQFTLENWRSLYPYTIRLQVEQGQDFVRPNLTVDYFFNYREGGLKLRFFAGKFIYLKEKTIRRQFANDRFHLNMTGPNGFEDYTYSDYFFGRNEFDNFYSQQIMIRDGAFKVRTDLLAEKVGKTDDWLMALNLDASLPRKLNPLSALPFTIPLHVFLDIGTYAGPWKRGAEGDRILFNCGLHLPLAKGVADFYFPIFYNGVYGDYFKSVVPKNRFFKTMSFTINFYTNEIKKINRELEF